MQNIDIGIYSRNETYFENNNLVNGSLIFYRRYVLQCLFLNRNSELTENCFNNCKLFLLLQKFMFRFTLYRKLTISRGLIIVGEVENAEFTNSTAKVLSDDCTSDVGRQTVFRTIFNHRLYLTFSYKLVETSFSPVQNRYDSSNVG